MVERKETTQSTVRLIENPSDADLDGLVRLTTSIFPHVKPEEPIPGAPDNALISDSLKSFFTTEGLTLFGMYEDETLQGFSVAIPASKMKFNKYDPSKPNEILNMPPDIPEEESAYIYWTIIDKEHQGKGKVQPLMEGMFGELAKTYTYVIRDCIGDLKDPKSYAFKVNKNYDGQFVTAPFEHKGFAGYGHEVRFVQRLVEQATTAK